MDRQKGTWIYRPIGISSTSHGLRAGLGVSPRRPVGQKPAAARQCRFQPSRLFYPRNGSAGTRAALNIPRQSRWYFLCEQSPDPPEHVKRVSGVAAQRLLFAARERPDFTQGHISAQLIFFPLVCDLLRHTARILIRRAHVISSTLQEGRGPSSPPSSLTARRPPHRPWRRCPPWWCLRCRYPACARRCPAPSPPRPR